MYWPFPNVSKVRTEFANIALNGMPQRYVSLHEKRNAPYCDAANCVGSYVGEYSSYALFGHPIVSNETSKQRALRVTAVDVQTWARQLFTTTSMTIAYGGPRDCTSGIRRAVNDT